MSESGGLPRDLPPLTSLRFFAAAGVLLLHMAGFVTLPPPLSLVALQGQSGVGFFFLLSGFILMHVYGNQMEGKEERRRFFVHRFARIFPLHLLALVLVVPVGIGLYAARFGARELSASWLANLALVQVWIPRESFEQAWNAPAWSVGCEAFFYLVFPLVAGRLRVSPPIRTMAFAYAATCGLFIVAFAVVTRRAEAGALDFADYWIVRNPLLRVGEFVLGCALYAELSRPESRLRSFLSTEASRTRALALSAGWLAALLALGAIFRSGHSSIAALVKALEWYVLPTPGFALLVVSLAAGRSPVARWLSHPLLVRLGEASYAMYMVHWVLWRPLMAHPESSLALRFALVAALFPLALMAHHYVEVPARSAIRRRFGA